MSHRLRIILAGTMALLMATAHAAQPAANELLLGSVAMDVPAAMVKRMTPLVRYLAAKTGIQVGFRPSPNLGSAVNELGEDLTQIAYLTPVAYVEAHDRYGAQPLASPITHGKSTFNLVVVVRNDSALVSMRDLKGRSFAFGDEKALLQRAVVVGGGVKMEELSRYRFLNHYDNIAKAVLNNDFDAGIMKDTLYEEFASKGLRKLYVSPPLPSYLFAVNKKLPAATVKKLRDAFLELKADTPGHKAILQGLDIGYDGFEVARDSDYDIVRRLTAPFKKSN